MGSVSLKVWNDHNYRTKEGYIVWLVVRQDDKRKVYKTGLHVSDPAQWNAVAEQFHTDADKHSVHPNAWENNRQILDLKQKINDILLYFYKNGIK